MPAHDEPRRSVALLLVDVINDFDFPGSEGLVRAAEACAPRLERLTERARGEGVPVIYVNDNFGRWRSDFRSTVSFCAAEEKKGRKVVRLLSPKLEDYFVLKPMHSGFLSTALDALLRHLGSRTLVLTGFAANVCVVFTANDAYMRGYRVVIPADCTAANMPDLTRAALEHARDVLGADTTSSDALDFATLEGPPRQEATARPGFG